MSAGRCRSTDSSRRRPARCLTGLATPKRTSRLPSLRTGPIFDSASCIVVDCAEHAPFCHRDRSGVPEAPARPVSSREPATTQDPPRSRRRGRGERRRLRASAVAHRGPGGVGAVPRRGVHRPGPLHLRAQPVRAGRGHRHLPRLLRRGADGGGRVPATAGCGGRGRIRQRLHHGAAAGTSRATRPGHGVLPVQHGGHRRPVPAEGPRRAPGGDHGLGRAPRQRLAGRLLRRSLGALPVHAPVPLLSRNRGRGRGGQRQGRRLHRERAVAGGLRRRGVPGGVQGDHRPGHRAL